MFRAANIQYMQCPKRRASDSGLAVAVRRAPLTPRFPRRSRHGSAVAAADFKGLKILKEVRRKLKSTLQEHGQIQYYAVARLLKRGAPLGAWCTPARIRVRWDDTSRSG